MKIVSFETPAGLRLGVVEGDQAIDLQAVDAKVPNELGALLAATKGDLSSVADLAKRACAAERVVRGPIFPPISCPRGWTCKTKPTEKCQ